MSLLSHLSNWIKANHSVNFFSFYKKKSYPKFLNISEYIYIYAPVAFSLCKTGNYSQTCILPFFSVCKCTSVYKTLIVIWLIRLHCGICHHPCIITSIIMFLLSSRAFHASSLPSPLLMTPVLSDSISVSVCGVQLHPATDLFKRDSKGEIIYLHTLTWDCLADLMTV